MSVLSLSFPDPWIALAIGNSRLHWALFVQNNIQKIDHTPHPALDGPQDWSGWQQLCPFIAQENFYPELWVASVVPSQTQLWQHYPNVTILKRADIPLQGMYPTFGLDRAITLWSAGITYGWPVLVIDGGTALTFTGADAEGRLVGGAILPGLRLQLRSLQSQTAELPWVVLPTQLPELWATETEAAMQSGVVYGAIAGLTYRIEQWLLHHPKAPIILTGGDADFLGAYLNLWHQQQKPLPWIQSLKLDTQLLLDGIAAIRGKQTR
jgi:type III pantothenate kinase